MSAPSNAQVRLAARPTGLPDAATWRHTREPAEEPGDGQVLVRVTHVSLDPAMRGWLDDVRSYVPPVRIGDVMRALGGGAVVASRAPGVPVGTLVTGTFGVQEYAVADAAGLTVADPAVADLPTHLGVLGMTGMTAYFGLFDVGVPQPGETVVVSGAAGAVGSVVGQLARIHGCRTVGIAGGPAKTRWLVEELGFDAAIDHRGEDVRRGLRAAAPDGIDVYFDNVGGEILDAALTRLRRGARVVICGAVSQYNAEAGTAGPRHYMSLLVHRARMQGFVVFDYADRYAEAARVMGRWLAEGRLQSRHDIVDGTVADFPDVLLRLFTGANTGKLILRTG